ncbi:unnamed protein product [Moneuplotes crassus]|uniref:Uncharacterized protein n=1 Tax=Euplotes crassus TaxID=5936 RepID=A0AAD1Y0R0_EUPCR|nr:unnamed protein product [Moneuplotes crassus]
MSENDESHYSDLDYLLKQKEEELKGLGAMRARALERTNEELKEQIEKFSNLLKIKEDENEKLRQQFSHINFKREEYENKINSLMNTLQEKEAVFYNDIMRERKESYNYKQEIAKLRADLEVNSYPQQDIMKLTSEFNLKKEKYEKTIQDLQMGSMKVPDYRKQLLEEKEEEINQIRTEYMGLLNQKNSLLSEKDRENEELVQQLEDKKRAISRLESDERLHEEGLRQHVDSLKKLVEVKNKSIDKLEAELQSIKEEMNLNEKEFLHEVKREKEDLLSMVRQERDQMQNEMKDFERLKTSEIRDLKRNYEEQIRSLEFTNQRFQKDNQALTTEYEAQESYIQKNTMTDEIKRVYEDCDRQVEKVSKKLREVEDRYKDLRYEFGELQEANLLMKQDLDAKDDYIEELENKEPKKAYEPVSSVMKGVDKFELETLKKKLKNNEEENVRLRAQVNTTQKELDRLKDNLIIREREIYNIKKSIANNGSFPSDKIKFGESAGKDKPKSEFMLSIESNPNLVNEFAKMTGSSGFKYSRGPYDESMEKMRKELRQQDKEFDLKTLSEASLSRQDETRSPRERTLALIMGEELISPTGDLKIDYNAVLEENRQLKMIIKEMRIEMENIAQQRGKSPDKNSFASLLSPKRNNYLDEANLKLLEKETEIEQLMEEIERLKGRNPDGHPTTHSVEKYEKKLEEKRKIIEKLREERDNLLEICSEMKIEINSMKKQQERVPHEENVNINNIVTKSVNMSQKKADIENVKSRLDNLGEHVQELFSDFKSALNQNKRGNPAFAWKRPNTASKANISVSAPKVTKLFSKFEKIQEKIRLEKRGILSSEKKVRKKSTKRRNKSSVRGIAMTLLERNNPSGNSQGLY